MEIDRFWGVVSPTASGPIVLLNYIVAVDMCMIEIKYHNYAVMANVIRRRSV
jgi:hypothetical protein